MFARVFHIYRIQNVDTKQNYVGQVASRSVVARWASHLFTARRGKGYDLHNAIRYHGEDKFVCEQIYCAFNREAMNWAEMKLIDEFKCFFPNGYNKTKGGSAGGRYVEEILFRGKSYVSFADLAREYNVNPQLCHQRISKYGWSLSQALEIEERPPTSPNSAKPIEIFGKKFESFRKSSEFYGLNESVVRGRLRNGWSLYSAYGLHNPPEKKVHNQKELIVDGNTFSSIESACAYYGIGRHRYFKHISKPDWTIEQIFKISSRSHKIGNSKPITVLNMHFASLSAACKHFGLYKRAVSARLKMGWTVLQAVGLEKPTRKIRKHPNSIQIKVNGLVYNSLSAAAAVHGLKGGRVSRRLKAGWSIEQALGIERHPKARI